MTHESGVSDLIAALREMLTDFPACAQVSASVVTFNGVLVTLTATPTFVTIADDNGHVNLLLGAES